MRTGDATLMTLLRKASAMQVPTAIASAAAVDSTQQAACHASRGPSTCGGDGGGGGSGGDSGESLLQAVQRVRAMVTPSAWIVSSCAHTGTMTSLQTLSDI